MIRRWSRVTNTLQKLTFSKNSYFFYFYVSFKKSTNFKRFRFKNTKFKRKTLIKAKHRKNWTIYLQIFKNWALDFKFSKKYIKYQLYTNVTILSFLTYNAHLRYNSRFANFSSLFAISNHLTKKTFMVLTNHKYWTFTSFLNSHTCLPSLDYIMIEKEEINPNFLPILFAADQTYYELQKNDLIFPSFNFVDIFDNFLQLNINFVLNFYQIWIVLWLKTLYR